MFNKKNLSEEFNETVGEIKEVFTTEFMRSSTSTMDANELMQYAKTLHMFNRIIDLFADAFEKQDRLMDKMDKALDKYLADDNK